MGKFTPCVSRVKDMLRRSKGNSGIAQKGNKIRNFLEILRKTQELKSFIISMKENEL